MDNLHFTDSPQIVRSTDQRLPSLPASDPESIAQNKFSGFYNIGARQFWKYAEINLHRIQDKESCLHFFASEGPEIVCKRCFIGFSGPGITASNGKLFINNVIQEF